MSPSALSGPSLAFLAGGQAERSGPVSGPGCLELQSPRPSVRTYKSQLDASGVLCHGGPEGLWRQRTRPNPKAPFILVNSVDSRQPRDSCSAQRVTLSRNHSLSPDL